MEAKETEQKVPLRTVFSRVGPLPELPHWYSGDGEKEEEETTVYSYFGNIFSLVFLTSELPAQNIPNTFLTFSNQINK
jgi:hypothetical protein